MIVFNRWAIVITVHSLNSVRMVFWINASVLKILYQIIFFNDSDGIIQFINESGSFSENDSHLGSTLAVASSMTRILFLWSSALARQINCFWPTDKFWPLSSSRWSSLFSVDEIKSTSSTCLSASQIASSVNSPTGSEYFYDTWFRILFANT